MDTITDKITKLSEDFDKLETQMNKQKGNAINDDDEDFLDEPDWIPSDLQEQQQSILDA